MHGLQTPPNRYRVRSNPFNRFRKILVRFSLARSLWPPLPPTPLVDTKSTFSQFFPPKAAIGSDEQLSLRNVIREFSKLIR